MSYEGQDPGDEVPPQSLNDMMRLSGDPDLARRAQEARDRTATRAMEVFWGEPAGTELTSDTSSRFFTIAQALTELDPSRVRSTPSGEGLVYVRDLAVGDGKQAELIFTTEGVNREAWPNLINVRLPLHEEADASDPSITWNVSTSVRMVLGGDVKYSKTRKRWDSTTQTQKRQSGERPATEEDVQGILALMEPHKAAAIDAELDQILDRPED